MGLNGAAGSLVRVLLRRATWQQNNRQHIRDLLFSRKWSPTRRILVLGLCIGRYSILTVSPNTKTYESCRCILHKLIIAASNWMLQHFPFKRRRHSKQNKKKRKMSDTRPHCTQRPKCFLGDQLGRELTVRCIISLSVSGSGGLFFNEHSWTKCSWWGLTIGKYTLSHSLASTKTWRTHLAEK